MVFKNFSKIKYLFGLVIFLGVIFINLSFAQAAFSADNLVTLTNSNRSQNGLGALSVNTNLTAAALAKAQDILAKDYFAHNSPEGKTPWDFIREAGYNYSYAGENLAIGYTDSGELFTAWMNSPTHRENILNTNYREIGIAVLSGDFQGAETTVVVQEFGTPAGATASPTAGPSQSPQVASTTPSPTASAQPENAEILKDKSEFSPTTIFVGEEVQFKVTVSGEIETLEAQVFDQKYNLKETGTLSTNGAEKTYTLKQKIENEGSSEVKILATDKAGNTKTLDLGKLETKKTTLAKENTASSDSGLFAAFKNTLRNDWFVYVFSLTLILVILGLYLVYRKNGLSKLMASWKI